MKSIKLAEDVVTLGTFKSKAPELLKLLSEQHRPLLLTQNGRSACVLLSPAEFDALYEKGAFLDGLTKEVVAADPQELIKKLTEYGQMT